MTVISAGCLPCRRVCLPLNLVDMAPSRGSYSRKLTEPHPVTSMSIRFSRSGGFVWSQPSIIRRRPLTRRSHRPTCLSISLPVQLVTDGPPLPEERKKKMDEMDVCSLVRLYREKKLFNYSPSLR